MGRYRSIRRPYGHAVHSVLTMGLCCLAVMIMVGCTNESTTKGHSHESIRGQVVLTADSITIHDNTAVLRGPALPKSPTRWDSDAAKLFPQKWLLVTDNDAVALRIPVGFPSLDTAHLSSSEQEVVFAMAPPVVLSEPIRFYVINVDQEGQIKESKTVALNLISYRAPSIHEDSDGN